MLLPQGLDAVAAYNTVRPGVSGLLSMAGTRIISTPGLVPVAVNVVASLGMVVLLFFPCPEGGVMLAGKALLAVGSGAARYTLFSIVFRAS